LNGLAFLNFHKLNGDNHAGCRTPDYVLHSIGQKHAFTKNFLFMIEPTSPIDPHAPEYIERNNNVKKTFLMIMNGYFKFSYKTLTTKHRFNKIQTNYLEGG